MRQSDFRDKTAIAGIGYSRSAEHPGAFSKNSGVDVLTLAVRAAREACADAGIDPKDIDGAVMYEIGGDSAPVRSVVSALGCRDNTYVSSLVGGGPLASLAIVDAAQAVYHGICEHVLVYRAMNGRSGVRMGQWGSGWGSSASGARDGIPRVGGASQFTSIYGLAGAVSEFAFEARRYLELYGVTSADLGRWAARSRSNAIANPRAIMRKPITVEDHQSSPLIAEPYHLLDCCLETDVGCAVIVTTAERARDLRARPVLVSAGSGGRRPQDEIMDTAMLTLGPRLLAAAGVERGDIDLFEAYDAFTDLPMRLLEDMGWCGRGEAKDFAAEGRTALDGEVPMNTHGGLINEGYCHGFNNVLEAVQQLRWEAEDLCPDWAGGKHTYDRAVCRQVREPEVALNVSVAGLSGLVLRRG